MPMCDNAVWRRPTSTEEGLWTVGHRWMEHKIFYTWWWLVIKVAEKIFKLYSNMFELK